MQHSLNPQIDHGVVAAQQDTGTPTFARSKVWGDIERMFLARAENSTCAACKRGKDQAQLQVHHKLPFHLCRLFQRPELEFNPVNLMTLCEVHHLYIGHLGDWQSFNEMVEMDIIDEAKLPPWSTLFEKLSFVENMLWKKYEQGRPKSYSQWDAAFRQHFADLIAQRFGATPPVEPISQLIFQWYGKRYSDSQITDSMNADQGTNPTASGGS